MAGGEKKGHKLRTIVERENMLPHCARRAQQQIRLHEVTRTQWRRLALEFYKKQRTSTLSASRAYSELESTFGDKEKMLLNDRVLVELQKKACTSAREATTTSVGFAFTDSLTK